MREMQNVREDVRVIWSDEKRKEYVKEMRMPASEIASRRSGRSTRIAFQLFADATGAPNKWFEIHDHAEYYAPKASAHLFDTMRLMAKDLGFFQFEFNRQKNSFRLNLTEAPTP